MQEQNKYDFYVSNTYISFISLGIIRIDLFIKKRVTSVFFDTLLVDDLDIPPEGENSDLVNDYNFWEKIEQMHMARGVCGKIEHCTIADSLRCTRNIRVLIQFPLYACVLRFINTLSICDKLISTLTQICETNVTYKRMINICY